MSAFEAASLLLSGGALVAVIVSLRMLSRQIVLMANQTEQLSRTLEVSVESSLDEIFVAVTQMYVDHPELRRVFHGGEVDPLDDDTLARAEALAETLADSMERALKLRRIGLEDHTTSLQPWIEDSIRGSRFFRAWLLTHHSWYSTELLSVAQRLDLARDDIGVTSPTTQTRGGESRDVM